MRATPKQSDSIEGIYPVRGYLQSVSEVEDIEDGRKKRTLTGVYCSQYGVVLIQAYFYQYAYQASELKMINNGKEYKRTFTKYYRQRTMAGLAMRFAEDVYSGAIKCK